MKRNFIGFAALIAGFVMAAPSWAAGAKVQVCHIPPGNPGNFHTITISENALQAHLGHGDLAGACFAHCDTLCSDGNACTIDACDSSERCLTIHPPVNCDDGNLCTTDTCDPATGCSSPPGICSDSNLCTVDSCDPLTGDCIFPPAACPSGETCNPASGTCDGIDECASSPCINGDCIDGPNQFTCQCLPGFTGIFCETDIDECESNPCVFGDCQDQVNGYVCTCQPGYTGIACEINIDECASSPCVFGECQDGVNRYDCLCDAGYTGTSCETPIE